MEEFGRVGRGRLKLEAGEEYWSRRGERVLITEIDQTGIWPVHFVVLTGRYAGVGGRDGGRLMLNGCSQCLSDGTSPEHGNDLVEEAVSQFPEGRELAVGSASTG